MMKLYCVVTEAEGLFGGKTNLIYDFTKNKFCVFTNEVASQLTFSLSQAEMVVEENKKARIVIYNLVSENE